MIIRWDCVLSITRTFTLTGCQITQSLILFQTKVELRRAVWEKNMQLVLRHNQEASEGKHSFTLGLNHLADMVRQLAFLVSSS